jgi:hypothetical protein
LPAAALFSFGALFGALLLGGILISFGRSLPVFVGDAVPIGAQMIILAIVIAGAVIAGVAYDPVRFRYAGLATVLATGGIFSLLALVRRMERGESIQMESHWGGIGGGLGGGLGGWRVSGALVFAVMAVALFAGAAAAGYAQPEDKPAVGKPAAAAAAAKPPAKPSAPAAPASASPAAPAKP